VPFEGRKALSQNGFLSILTVVGQSRDTPGTIDQSNRTMETNDADRALTRKQVAWISTYSEKTLANLASLKKGPPFRKYRGRVLYLESEVMAWLRGLPRSGGQAA